MISVLKIRFNRAKKIQDFAISLQESSLEKCKTAVVQKHGEPFLRMIPHLYKLKILWVRFMSSLIVSCKKCHLSVISERNAL